MMSYLPDEILVVMALRDEGGHRLEAAGAQVLYTGLGKVNAAYHLTRQLSVRKPAVVVNMGTAGSQVFKRGDIVACNQFIQRDMDTSPLGYARFATPFEDTPIVIEHRPLFTALAHARCGSGDSFVTDHDPDAGEVVDMEAYALAKVCLLESVPFACVKYISDGANDDANDHWEENLHRGAEAFVQIFTNLIDKPTTP